MLATEPRLSLAQTPRATLHTEGTASLYRFGDGAPAGCARGKPSSERGAFAPRAGTPLLIVPSLINRWYVLDLRPGASVVEALVAAGIDTWLLDWGVPEAEDRYRSWTDVLDTLARATRRVLRHSKASKLGLLGYCMGGTLATIHAALHPAQIAALVDLAGPIDFAKGGMLRRMVDPQWFDGGAIADAGNVMPDMMQAGFTALRPTLDLAKLMAMPDLVGDPEAQLAHRALETWASDTIAFPGEAYRTYITDLYQGNALVEGRHRVRDRVVDLGAIQCPTLAIVADRDAICPADAATALLGKVGTKDTATLRVPGGHVGAVVGRRASRDMYPALIAWLRARI